MKKRNQKTKINLIKAIQNHFLLFTALLVGAIITALPAVQYLNYVKQAEESKEGLLQIKKDKITSQVNRAMDYIQFARKKNKKRMQRQLGCRVEEILNQMKGLYQKNQDLPRNRITELLKDTVRSLSWNQGNGYHFIVDIQGKVLLHPHNPGLEGKNFQDITNPNKVLLTQRVIQKASKENVGSVTYKLPKKKDQTPEPKFFCVQQFKPLGWILGAGVYLAEHQVRMRKEIKERLSQISYDQGKGYIFVKSYKGHELVNRTQPDLIGKNILDLKDPNGVLVVQELIKAAKALSLEQAGKNKDIKEAEALLTDFEAQMQEVISELKEKTNTREIDL